MIVLPFPDKPASHMDVIIDDVAYRMLLAWNERAGAWSLGLEDTAGNGLLYGRRIVLKMDILGGFHHLAIPTGAIFAIDPTGQIKSISRDVLPAGRVLLYYVPKAELDAL